MCVYGGGAQPLQCRARWLPLSVIIDSPVTWTEIWRPVPTLINMFTDLFVFVLVLFHNPRPDCDFFLPFPPIPLVKAYLFSWHVLLFCAGLVPAWKGVGVPWFCPPSGPKVLSWSDFSENSFFWKKKTVAALRVKARALHIQFRLEVKI